MVEEKYKNYASGQHLSQDLVSKKPVFKHDFGQNFFYFMRIFYVDQEQFFRATLDTKLNAQSGFCLFLKQLLSRMIFEQLHRDFKHFYRPLSKVSELPSIKIFKFDCRGLPVFSGSENASFHHLYYVLHRSQLPLE